MVDPARTPPAKIATYLFFFVFLYIFIPLYLHSAHLLFRYVFLFYAGCILIVLILFKKYSDRKSRLEYQAQEIQEKINILSDKRAHEKQIIASLETKISRYNSLKEIIERINQDLDFDSVANSLTTIASSVISGNKCVCLLYLIDPQTQKLILFKTRKKDEQLIIKAKEGDIFDQWVLRHSNPLLVEDIKKDFRFDLERLKTQDLRPMSSLISAPFISGHRFLGILRLDSTEAGSFSQDDLRLLVTICDIGAVALENSELYKKTQDLAIHDSLTSLYTKRYFYERLKEECKRSIRQGTVFSLLVLDIDHFKDYNDKFGHTAGDLVLQKLSANIMGSLKDYNPLACRFGGEEFCVILDQVDKKGAMAAAEILRQAVEKERLVLRRQETKVTVSIGVAAFPVDAIEDNELLLKADKAMYEGKQKGRNRVVGA